MAQASLARLDGRGMLPGLVGRTSSVYPALHQLLLGRRLWLTVAEAQVERGKYEQAEDAEGHEASEHDHGHRVHDVKTGTARSRVPRSTSPRPKRSSSRSRSWK